jgi:hypothetical protein
MWEMTAAVPELHGRARCCLCDRGTRRATAAGAVGRGRGETPGLRAVAGILSFGDGAPGARSVRLAGVQRHGGVP